MQCPSCEGRPKAYPMMQIAYQNLGGGAKIRMEGDNLCFFYFLFVSLYVFPKKISALHRLNS